MASNSQFSSSLHKVHGLNPSSAHLFIRSMGWIPVQPHLFIRSMGWLHSWSTLLTVIWLGYTTKRWALCLGILLLYITPSVMSLRAGILSCDNMDELRVNSRYFPWNPPRLILRQYPCYEPVPLNVCVIQLWVIYDGSLLCLMHFIFLLFCSKKKWLRNWEHGLCCIYFVFYL